MITESNRYSSVLKTSVMSMLGIVLVLGMSAQSFQAQASKLEKPNIIIVITDDQGKGDLACMGNPYIQTPALDQFYEESVRLADFHVSTTCAPSRGALLTGRHTNRLNVFHTIAGRSLLFEDEVLLSQILAQNGYTNGMFGKWHLGDNYPFRPEDRGFHEVLRHGGGGITQGPDYWGNDYFDDSYWHNGELEQFKGYCTDVFFSEALKFIEKNKDKPFFCYLSTNAPHGPLNVPKGYFDLYKNQKALNDRFKRFYGMISNIDDNFKILREKLEDWNIADNTLLIFMTDNGTAGGNQIFDGGLRGAKASQYEGGHRVPFFIYWKDGNITGGKDVHQLTAHYDVLPTLVDILGISHNSIKKLDGISFYPLLQGSDEYWPYRTLYVDTQRGQNLVKYKQYSVMDQEWRLVDGKELYRISEDLGQKNNVIKKYPEVASKLGLAYEKWWQSIKNERVNEKYAYIKVGSKFENPSRISSHDMMTGKFTRMWHQYGAVAGVQASGKWKIEFVEDGNYQISLRRFPRESGLAINDTFPEEEKVIELEQVMPASTKNDFTAASLYVAHLESTQKISAGQHEVVFIKEIPAGKYDMEAQLIDSQGRVHPAYYLYIEKL